MEQRLIDANALMDALNVFRDRKNGNEHFMYGIETAKELLGIQPALDAVPVVRCAECVHFAEWTEYEKTLYGFRHDGMCKYWNHHSTNKNGFCDQGVRITDGFCADGERRSDEQ